MDTRKWMTGVLIVVFATLFAVPVLAGPWQGWRGSGGWGAGSVYQRMYNTATVAAVSGEVVSIDKLTPMKGMNYGIHLLVKTGDGDVSVHLGPAWYVERLDTKINKGDRVDVKGSRITINGKPAHHRGRSKKR